MPVFNGNDAPSAAIATTEASANETLGQQIYKHLMNGVSHMLTFVIGSSIMIALAFLFDMQNAGGSGFFGALFAVFIAGYLIPTLGKAFKNLPASLESTKPVLLYPVLGLALIWIIMTFIINPPTAVFNK